MEELEHTSRQLKLNSENLESLCSDKLSQLHQEKRKARKQYQEEHSKIATQFSHVSGNSHIIIN
jgi:single-stranded DNA-specific DHH superfamily exonuclease